MGFSFNQHMGKDVFHLLVVFFSSRLNQTGWEAMLRQAVHFQYCHFSKLNLKILKMLTCDILVFSFSVLAPNHVLLL